MREFIEVDVVCSLGEGLPDYVKPDIGITCIKLYKQFISWEDIGRSCLPSPQNPQQWTNIFTPLGASTIAMPYEEVCKNIKAAVEKQEHRHELERLDRQKNNLEMMSFIKECLQQSLSSENHQ